jgi:hypothetical protein
MAQPTNQVLFIFLNLTLCHPPIVKLRIQLVRVDLGEEVSGEVPFMRAV